MTTNASQGHIRKDMVSDIVNKICGMYQNKGESILTHDNPYLTLNIFNMYLNINFRI